MALLAKAQGVAAAYPPLLAQAIRLAETVNFGNHGRRRPGTGEAFWQYRPAMPGDSLRQIDWRRSGRGDETFVREEESQIAQSVLFWCDNAASMTYQSGGASKAERAQLLTLALAHLALRGGERVGSAAGGLKTRAGLGQMDRLYAYLADQAASGDYGRPLVDGLVPGAFGVFLSDFLGPLHPIEAALGAALDRGTLGVLVTVLDSAEMNFNFKGRTVFQSMEGSVVHETNQAADLQAGYDDALQKRIKTISDYAAAAGWGFHLHSTDQSPKAALAWLHGYISGAMT
ncbi:MAG: DUF58 domain-containing protein [Planktomarina sp.]